MTSGGPSPWNGLARLQDTIAAIEGQVSEILASPPREIRDVLPRFTTGAGRCLGLVGDGAGAGYLGLRSFVLRANVDRPAGVGGPQQVVAVEGTPVHRHLREFVLPQVNMSHLMFKGRGRLQRARFYVGDGEESAVEALRGLRKSGNRPRHILLMTKKDAVPTCLRRWHDKWSKWPSDGWTGETPKQCLEDLTHTVAGNARDLEREALRTYVEQCGSTFPGAQDIAFLGCVETSGPGDVPFWNYKEHDSGEPLPLMAPREVSPFLLWWAVYALKCALNVNQYALYCVSPAAPGRDRSGVILIADLTTDLTTSDTEVLCKVMALEAVGHALLSGVDRIVLAWTEAERRGADVAAARARERSLQQDLWLRSFGHDGKRPAITLVRVAARPWSAEDKVVVSGFLASSLWHRLGSYSSLIGFTDRDEVQRILAAEAGDATSVSPLSALWRRELLALLFRTLVDGSEWQKIREALWGNADPWPRLRAAFEPILEMPLSTDTAVVTDELADAMARACKLLEAHQVFIEFAGPDLGIPQLTPGGDRRPEARLGIGLAFVLGEIATNAFKHHFPRLPKLIGKTGLRALIQVREEEQTPTYSVQCLFSPALVPAPTDYSPQPTKTFTGLMSLASVAGALGCRVDETELTTAGGRLCLPYPRLEGGANGEPLRIAWALRGLSREAVRV